MKRTRNKCFFIRNKLNLQEISRLKYINMACLIIYLPHIQYVGNDSFPMQKKFLHRRSAFFPMMVRIHAACTDKKENQIFLINKEI